MILRSGRKIVFIILVVSTTGCLSKARYVPHSTILSHDTVDCVVEWQDVWPVVSARVNGQGPFRFVVDTGAGMLFISEEVAESLAAEEVSVMRTLDAAGNKCREPVVRVDTLTIEGRQPCGDISEARFEHLRAVVTGMTNLPNIDGMIGFSVFGDCALTLDYPENRVQLKQHPSNGTDWLALQIKNYTAAVEVEICGCRECFILDSGSHNFINVNRGLANLLEFEAPPRRLGKGLATNGKSYWQNKGRLKEEFRLGDCCISRPIVTIDNGPSRIGGDFLRFFSVTFDRNNGRFFLSGGFPNDFQIPPIKGFGIWIRARSKTN